MSVTQGSAERYQICRIGRNSARCFKVPTRMPYDRGSCGSVGVYRCAAVGAEGVGAFVAVFGRLGVSLWSAGSQKESADRSLHGDSVGGTSERLAISAVTNTHGIRVDLGYKSNVSAMATAFDFHGRPRERINPRKRRL